MLITFSKYQGTGNDFIIIDNREQKLALTTTQIIKLCDRKFGVGADGLILLENENGCHFRMVYFNADGNESSMCGNGGRCITALARKLNLFEKTACFMAIDGLHQATCDENVINLRMKNVDEIENFGNYFLADTGSPHVVCFVSNLKTLSVFDEARKIRYNDQFSDKGTNVNFVEINNERLFVRTYERGVEDETLSCGTGVTAAAIVSHHLGKITKNNIEVVTPGGKLNVKFENAIPGYYNHVYLSGPATFVFEGRIELR